MENCQALLECLEQDIYDVAIAGRAERPPSPFTVGRSTADSWRRRPHNRRQLQKIELGPYYRQLLLAFSSVLKRHTCSLDLYASRHDRQERTRATPHPLYRRTSKPS
jgi:hypothetical protein